MKIIKGEKYLCTRDVVMDTNETLYFKGKVYPSEQNRCITNEDKDIGHSWSSGEYFEEDRPETYFQPLSEAKWAVKRTPENADVLNNWANSKDEYLKGDQAYLNVGGYLHSDMVHKAAHGLVNMLIVDGYTEISFDTFKEIVGIEEEKEHDVDYSSADWMILGHNQQTTEEWQPKYGEDVEAKCANGGSWIKAKYLCRSLYKANEHWCEFFGGASSRAIALREVKTEILMSEALEIIAQAKGINKEQIKIV